MKNFLKRLFGKQVEQVDLPKREFTLEENEQYFEVKKNALEKILGHMYDLVGHAIVPFQIGGAVDMYYFPDAHEGTALVTMELIEPDGSGPTPNSMGTFELIAFTKHKIDSNNDEGSAFGKIERRICGIFTSIGNYSYQAKLEPGETCEIPEDEGSICMLFAEYKKQGVDFNINGQKHGLLLCIEVFPSEMHYAMEHGSQQLITLLKEANYYPLSDLDRNPVV